MTLTFVGDISLTSIGALDSLPRLSRPIVANLEGPVARDPLPYSDPVVFSSSESIEAIVQAGYGHFSLANNHIMDLGVDGLRQTIRTLGALGADHFGAGDTLADASKPLFIDNDTSSVAVIGAGWPLIGCVAAGGNRPGCAPTDVRRDIARVEALVHHGTAPIVFVHWGYELGSHPLPGHVSYARSLADAGAVAVIGAHAHVVQGHEFYNDCHIFYGLGNWLFDEGVFHGGRIRFPMESRAQVSASIEVDSYTANVSSFVRSLDGTFSLVESGDPQRLPFMADLSPFRGRSVAEYARWYRSHVPRRGLPIVKHRPGQESRTVKEWIRARTSVARAYRRVSPRTD